MTIIERSVYINATSDAINDVALNPELLPIWFPGIKQAEPDDLYPQKGGKIHILYQAAGAIFRIILAPIENLQHLNFTGHLDGSINGTYKIAYKLDNDGTRVEISLDYIISDNGLSHPIDHHLLERENSDNLEQGLKNLCAMVHARSPLQTSGEFTAREYMGLKKEIDEAIHEVLASGVFVEGEQVAALEAEFAKYCGVHYAITTSSGTMAILVALKALGIGPGDEVITTPYTSNSTTTPITNAGARIRFADVEGETLTLDPAQVEARLTPNTRAILPVHLHGYVVEMGPLIELAEKHDLYILEDVALAAGATYHGRRAGSLAHAGAFSFAPNKILGGIGWGGIVTTNIPEIAARAVALEGYGHFQPRSLPVFPRITEKVEGFRSSISSLEAAGLRVKLPHLESWIKRRREIAARLDEACDSLGFGRLHPHPRTEPTPRSYIILTEHRDDLHRHLKREGVRMGADYLPPLHLRTVYSDLGYQKGDFPVAEHAASELICLAIHPQLTDDEVGKVIKALENFS